MTRKTDRAAQDRQRIYTAIIQHLSVYGTQYGTRYDSTPGREAEPGDLVLSSTRFLGLRGWDPWMVGFLVRGTSYGNYTVRDVASSRECDVTNDMFSVIRGIPSYLLLAGHQYDAYAAVQRAYRTACKRGRISDYNLRLHSVVFADRDTREGEILLRPHIFRYPSHRVNGTLVAVVKRIPITANARLRSADIQDALEAASKTPWSFWTSKDIPQSRTVWEGPGDPPGGIPIPDPKTGDPT